MKLVALYTDKPVNAGLQHALVEAQKELMANVTYRGIAAFKASQPEKFDLAIVDMSARGGENVAKAIEAWGIPVKEVYPADPDGGEDLDKMNAKKLLAYAAAKGIEVPPALKSAADIRVFIKDYESKLAGSNDPPSTPYGAEGEQ